jgi:hypothetical protein
MQVGGLWVGIGGAVAGLGLAGVSTAIALSKNDASKPECTTGNLCTAQGISDRNSAITASNVATAGAIGAAVFAGAGITMFLLGRPGSAEATAPASSRPTVRALPMIGADTFGGLLQGSF